MERCETLRERYEDALFALLMDEIATAEGKRLWEENERLKNDPAAQIPEVTDRRCKQVMRRCFAKRAVCGMGQATAKTFKIAAMAAGIAAMLFTSAFAASETVRVSTINLVIEVFGEGTDFYFGQGEILPNASLQMNVGWIPEGYVLSDQGSDDVGMWCQYQKSESEFIHIEYICGDGTVLTIDTEDAEVQQIEMNGLQGTWVKKGNFQQLVFVWVVDHEEFFCTLSAEGMTEEALLHVASELKYR